MSAPVDYLTPAELQAITGKARPYLQAGALARLGVPFAFNGKQVRLLRLVAEAHEVLPAGVKASGVDLSKVR